MKTIHELKIWPEHFDAITKGWKTAELRINDRNFRRGDLMLLKEYDLNAKKYTDRQILTYITWVTDSFYLKENIVMISFKII
jgi:ASC-1-like (ASCH) protein